jgi:hypothetical protein
VASAQAKIDIVVKNLNSLNRLDKTLDKLNATNQSLISGIDKLTKSINNLSRAKGLDDISVSANRASASVEKVIDKTNVLQNLGRRARGNLVNAGIAGGMVGGGALAGGVLGGGAAINTSMGVLNKVQRALHLGTTNVNGYAAAWAGISSTIKATAIPAIKLMGAAVMSNPVFGGIAAALLVTFGDKIWETTKKIDGLGRSIFQIGQSAGNELQAGLLKASFSFKPIRTEIELTTQALLKLDERFKAPRGIITSKNRAFGIRQRGTPEEEEVRMRNRRINQRASEDSSARFLRERAIQRSAEFKNLPTVKSYRAILAVEKKRLLIHQRNLRATEKLNMLAQAQGTTITGFSAAQYGPQQAPPIPLTRIEQLGFGKRANAQGMFASRGGMGGRGRGAFSSAMIGGMFPLLFGQGRAASLGGGIGGLAGGALGGGLGFGLSLFGTVIGSKIQEIDDFNKSLTRLNATLSSSGDGFKTTGKDVSELAKRLGVTKQEAINVLNAFAQFDSSGVRKSLANVFGTDAGAVDQIASARTEASLVQTIFEKRQELGLEVTEQLIDQSKIVDNATLEFALVAATLKKKKEIAVEEAKRISIMERMNALVNPFKNPALIFAPENKDRAAKIEAGFEDTFQEDIDNALQSFQDLRRVMDKVALASATDLAEALREVNIEITKLQNPTYQLIEAANAISGAFSESFKGVIRGTMSVQEAFANMFNRIADHFLDMAAKMAANQLLTSILSAFAPAVSGPSAPKLNRVTGNPGPRTAPIIPRATGGYVTRPEVSLIGEAGEDEYVIPASKMASSMQRYSAGARGDAVVAGGGSSYASGGARGSTTVNYSGPILNFNSEEFVPKSAVGQIIATATSRGAKAGEARTLSSLQNSRSRRSNLGL